MNVLNYTYAQLCTAGDRWYVHFSAFDPASQTLKRKRQYINRLKSATLRRRFAERLITEINRKLDYGWNPWLDVKSSPKIYTSLFSALDLALELKLREIEKSSMPNYRQRIRALKEWLQLRRMENIRCFEFTGEMAVQFMNDLYIERDISGVTYNNYIIDYRSYFNLLIRNKYFTENPFKEIQKKKEKEKAKLPWNTEQQQRYREYLLQHDYDFWIISMYCYYFAIRPKEICLLRVKDVNFTHNYINVNPEISKNDRQRQLPIPVVYREELKKYLKQFPSDFYLCSKNCKPGPEPVAPTRIAERFREIADELHFPSEIKFYGLKDTCAEMLIRAGVHAKTIQTLFDHTSLKTTDAYLSRISAPQLEQLTGMFPVFGNQS